MNANKSGEALINTPLQRGGGARDNVQNRFNGFPPNPCFVRSTRDLQLPLAQRTAAFTLVECLAIVAILSLLFATLVPGLSRSQPRGQALRCLNNLRQLTLAWVTYAADSNDTLAINSFGPEGVGNWIQGTMDWGTTRDNTNTVLLTDPRNAKLAPYFGRTPGLFKCPADTYLSSMQGTLGWKQRVRSISMNAGVGAGSGKQVYVPPLRIIERLSELNDPRPEGTWVLADEQADSINDPCLLIRPVSPESYNWIDLPAAYHSSAGSFSFADGHVELKKWRDSRTLLRPTMSAYYVTSCPNSPDFQWLVERTPRWH